MLGQMRREKRLTVPQSRLGFAPHRVDTWSPARREGKETHEGSLLKTKGGRGGGGGKGLEVTGREERDSGRQFCSVVLHAVNRVAGAAGFRRAACLELLTAARRQNKG